MNLLSKIESVSGILGLGFIVLAATILQLTHHLDSNMVSILQWAGSSFMAAIGAAHIGQGLGK